MATWRQWMAGARPRTLSMAVSSVVAGTGAAADAGEVRWARAGFPTLRTTGRLTLGYAVLLAVGLWLA